jgi:1-acyl-sn-glycerol-3-phosphate acyltransferase
MPDAEVIPLGTRGRPGRGTGSNKPSRAARTLAGATKPPADRAGGRGTGAGEPGNSEPEVPARPGSKTAPKKATPSAAKRTAQKRPAAKPPEVTKPVLEEALGPDAVRLLESVREPSPSKGIPVGDWLSAFAGASKELFGENWEPRMAEFLAFLRRRVTGDYQVDEYGFDAEISERFFLSAIRPIAQKWFRVVVRGVENIPDTGGALLVSNHSGTVPVDGLMTMVSVHDRTGRNLRPLGADLVFRLPVFGELARKGGATLACNEDAQRMLRGGELVGVWPEGFKGIGKPYSERYKLQRFGRGGFVAAAIRTGVPIIPCAVVGAEEIYPLVGNVPALARLLGVPYIPITPFFPLLGPLGMVPLPSKWLIEFSEPIRTDSYDEGAADDPMLVFNVTDQVRETIQQTLYTLLMQRKSVFH